MTKRTFARLSLPARIRLLCLLRGIETTLELARQMGISKHTAYAVAAGRFTAARSRARVENFFGVPIFSLGENAKSSLKTKPVF